MPPASSPEASDDPARLNRAYTLALARPPTADELASDIAFLTTAREKLRTTDTPADQNETAAWQAMMRVIFRLNEFVYLD